MVVEELKSLKKDLVKFKKVVKKDMKEGKDLSFAIKGRIARLRENKEVLSNPKVLNELTKLSDAINLYDSQIRLIEDFQKKHEE